MKCIISARNTLVVAIRQSLRTIEHSRYITCVWRSGIPVVLHASRSAVWVPMSLPGRMDLAITIWGTLDTAVQNFCTSEYYLTVMMATL